MTGIIIRHTPAEGTLVEGSRKGDGIWEILKGLRGNWRYFPSLGQIGISRSRDKPAQRQVIENAAGALREAGFTVAAEIDDAQTRPFAEAEAGRYERAEDRAAHHASAGASASGRSEAAWRRSNDAVAGIEPGQPILVGHHSERGHRRAIDRSHAAMRRSVEEEGKAVYHAERREAAERFRDRRESIPVTLRRIEKLEADKRRLERSRADASGDRAERLGRMIAGLDGELGYWQEHVKMAEADGVKVWGPDDFAKGDFAQRHGQWVEVLRVNRKSLTVPALLDMRAVATKEGQRYSWTDPLPYDKVTGRRTVDEMTAALAP